jgi:A/G-specific adenine glycosylase
MNFQKLKQSRKIRTQSYSEMTQKDRIENFQKLVWDFYRKNERRFPWRETTDPYKILVSEIMLQQTQADRVVAFYERWIKRFPDFTSLAGASFREIYPFWQGLGYNRRALALQKTAQKAVAEFGGKLPPGVQHLEEFPGIGPYTARAVAIFAFNAPVACIETNIRRAFIHHFFGDKTNIEDKEILEIAQRARPAKPRRSREWHYALMDYGAYLKTQVQNPNRRHKNYTVQSKFEGSLRQIRGATLKMLSAKPMGEAELTERLKKATLQTQERIKKVILALEKEGLVKQSKKVYSLN